MINVIIIIDIELRLILELTIYFHKLSGPNVKKPFWHAYLKNPRSRDGEETQLAFKLQRSLGHLSLLADLLHS